MKIGTLEVPAWKAAVLIVVWLACWSWPVAVRPLVFRSGQVADAHVRVLQKQLFGLRCEVIAATKLGQSTVRFYAYADPQACSSLQVGSAVKLGLLKAGPAYWVQLQDDFGYYRSQWILDIVLFILVTSLVAFAIYRLTRPRQRPRNSVDFLELIRNF